MFYTWAGIKWGRCPSPASRKHCILTTFFSSRWFKEVCYRGRTGGLLQIIDLITLFTCYYKFTGICLGDVGVLTLNKSVLYMPVSGHEPLNCVLWIWGNSTTDTGCVPPPTYYIYMTTPPELTQTVKHQTRTSTPRYALRHFQSYAKQKTFQLVLVRIFSWQIGSSCGLICRIEWE